MCFYNVMLHVCTERTQRTACRGLVDNIIVNGMQKRILKGFDLAQEYHSSIVTAISS